MQVIAREKFGIELTAEQAFEVLSNLTHFVYLTEYCGPDNPLRTNNVAEQDETETNKIDEEIDEVFEVQAA